MRINKKKNEKNRAYFLFRPQRRGGFFGQLTTANASRLKSKNGLLQEENTARRKTDSFVKQKKSTCVAVYRLPL